MLRTNLVFCLLLIFALNICSQSTFAGPPSIESISTPVVQLGKTAQIEIVGAGLKQVQEIVFYSSGIRAVQLVPADDYKLVATIEVVKDCEIKNHPFRLRGETGFSELRTLRVNRFPVVQEPSRESVKTVVKLQKLDQTVCGVLESGDYDRYSIHLEKGQRFTAEAEAMRLGGDLLDTVLTVWDPSGTKLKVSDDSHLFNQDPFISFNAPTSGEYLVEIRESNYGGSSNSRYLLHLGNFPASRIAYPAGAQLALADQTIRFVNESGVEATEQAIPLLNDASSFQLFAVDELGVSASPIPFRLNDCQNVMEVEPNNVIRDAIQQMPRLLQRQTSSSDFAAVAFNGLLQEASDIDLFAFEATEGQALACEVFANRIGSPIDSYLELYDRFGKLLAQNDDCDSHDSKLVFVVPASGVYLVAVRDKLHRGFNAGVYRIEVRKNQPALTAFLPRPERISQRQQTVAVPQGNRSIARLGVLRENIEGEVQLRFENLPQGVRATPVYVSPDEYWAIAILEADDNAPIGGQLSSVIATCQAPQGLIQGKFQQTVDLIAESADRLYQSAVVDRLAVAVTTPLPFAIQIKQPKVSLSVNGTIDLEVAIQRNDEFKAPIQIEFPYLPDGCVGEPTLVIPADQTSALYRVAATRNAITGGFHLAAIASVQLSEGRNRVDDRSDARPRERSSRNQSELNAFKDREAVSNLVDLEVVPNPLQGRFLGLASEPGINFKVSCDLQASDWSLLPIELTAQLEGLPKGISTKPVSTQNLASQVIFEVNVSADAPVGEFKGLQCRLSGVKDGSDISFVIPCSDELFIAEPGKLIRSEDGSVLSPLEALRKQKSN